jgi:hypothetical protein
MKRIFTTERQRLEFEQWERQDREEQERPIKQAEAELLNAHRQLTAIQRSNLLDVKDVEVYVSPELDGARMTLEQAKAFNRQSAEQFVAQTPEHYPSPRNFDLLTQYFLRNDCEIVSVDMWAVAFRKFMECGLLESAPLPPEPVSPAPAQEDIERLPRLPLNHQSPIAYKQEPDGSQEGWDLATGERRVYSSYEIKMLSSDDYKRAFGVPTTYLSKGNFLR